MPALPPGVLVMRAPLHLQLPAPGLPLACPWPLLSHALLQAGRQAGEHGWMTSDAAMVLCLPARLLSTPVSSLHSYLIPCPQIFGVDPEHLPPSLRVELLASLRGALADCSALPGQACCQAKLASWWLCLFAGLLLACCWLQAYCWLAVCTTLPVPSTRQLFSGHTLRPTRGSHVNRGAWHSPP